MRLPALSFSAHFATAGIKKSDDIELMLKD
jgi:hypothetical protein